MENSHIQWTDHTFNPWIGCTKVSPGCTHCYAEAQNQRWRKGVNWGKGAPRSRTSVANWKGPLKWNREAGRDLNARTTIHRPRVFCASLADWLDDEVPIDWLVDLLSLIHATPNLDWLLLTKRPYNWEKRMDAARLGGSLFAFGWLVERDAPPNVWIGSTVENQDYTARHAHLMEIPARVHFWSVEPMLSGLSTSLAWHLHGKPDWVICGGESGPGARVMDEQWARSIAGMCKLNGVAFFMKQMGGGRDARGELAKIPEDLRIRQFPQLTAAKD